MIQMTTNQIMADFAQDVNRGIKKEIPDGVSFLHFQIFIAIALDLHVDFE